MKTTIDLPEDLVRQLKLRAVNDGRKLKDIAADLLRSGLAGPSIAKKSSQPVVLKDKKTGLPVIQCRRPASRGRQATPERVARILADQEIEWSRESA